MSRRTCPLFALALASFLMAVPAAASQSSTAATRNARARRASSQFQQVAKQADEALAAGNLDEAIVLYNKGIRMDHRWMEGLWHLGTILYEKDRYEEASEVFRALSAQLDSATTTNRDQEGRTGKAPSPAISRAETAAMLGLCEFEIRDYDRAGYDLYRGQKLGLEKNPEIVRVVVFHLGMLLVRSGHYEEAYKMLTPLARVKDEPGNETIAAFGLSALRMPFLPDEVPPDKRDLVLLAGRANYYDAAQQVPEATKAFKDLVSRYSGTPNVHYAYGTFLQEIGGVGVVEQFNTELEIQPNHVPSMMALIFIDIDEDKLTDALALAEKVVILAPDDFRTHYVLGRILAELGAADDTGPEGAAKLARGIKELEKAEAMEQDAAAIHFALARAYIKVKRTQEAERERQIFLKLNKERSKEETVPLPNQAAPQSGDKQED